MSKAPKATALFWDALEELASSSDHDAPRLIDELEHLIACLKAGTDYKRPQEPKT